MNDRLLEELHAMLGSPEAHGLWITEDGEVFVATDGARRPHHRTLSAAELQHLGRAIGDGPAAERRIGPAVWSVLRAPLVPALSISARRAPRMLRALGDFVEKGLMSGDTAQTIVGAVREAQNILVTGPDRDANLAVFDALLGLVPPGQPAYVLAGADELDPEVTPAVVLDRATLDGMGGAARLVEARLAGARWVFSERVETPDDLRWWLGGQCFGSGRVATVTAINHEAACNRVRMLHQAAFRHDLDATEHLVGIFVQVAHLRTGRGESIEVHQARSSARPVSRETRRSRPLGTSAVDTPRVMRSSSETAVAPVVEARKSARPKSDEVPAQGVTRKSATNPRLRRPASLEIARTGQMPKLETPTTQTSNTPGRSPTSSGVEHMAAAAFGDLSEIFEDELAGPPSEPNPSDLPSLDAEPVADESGGFGLFGPGELDDVFADSDAASAAPAAPPSNPRHPAPGAPASRSRYNADTARDDAETIRQSRYNRTPSQDQMPSASRPTSPMSAVGPRHGQDWNDSGPGRPLVGRGAATRRKLARPQSAEVLSSEEIELLEVDNPAVHQGNSYMQEGTLGDDVKGDFADEPTRRAEWPSD